MAFELTARPDGEYPAEYFEGDWGWPDEEYDRSPHFSAKFARGSDILSEQVIERLYGHIEAHEAVSLAGDIEAATRKHDAADPDHLQKLARFAQWLRYWGNRGVEISGGP